MTRSNILYKVQVDWLEGALNNKNVLKGLSRYE